MVACQLPKLNARVRFPLPAPERAPIGGSRHWPARKRRRSPKGTAPHPAGVRPDYHSMLSDPEMVRGAPICANGVNPQVGTVTVGTQLGVEEALQVRDDRD